MSKRYIIKIDPDISEVLGEYFFTRVRNLLNDSKWPNHKFTYVESGYNNEDTPVLDNYDILIVLLERDKKHILLKESESTLSDQPTHDGHGEKIDLEVTEFSYTFYSTPNVIIIDNTNWNEAHIRLKISKSDYESYVIYHEVGHAIGKKHRPIPDDNNKPYPIMYQATLGLPDIGRFRPHPNESDDLS